MTNESQLTASQDELNLLDIALVVAENIRILIVVPVAAGLVALGISFFIAPSYTAVTRVLPPQQQQSSASALLANQLGVLAGGVGATLGVKNPADLYVGMLKSRTVADRLLTHFKLRQLYDAKYDEDARKELSNRSRIVAGKEGLIVIEVDDEDPKRAADLANAYVAALRDLGQTLAVTEAAQRRLFFERQLKQAKDDLTRSEVVLRESGISEAALKTVPQSVLEALARLKAEVTTQEVKLSAMRGYMTESNPDYKQAQQELAALRIQLAKAEQIDAKKATGVGAEYIAKFREFKYHETLFELMAKQYEMARLDEAREGALIQVVDTAVPPERKSKPKRAVIGLVTTMAGLFLVFLMVLFRHALRSAGEIPQYARKLAQLKQLILFRRL